MVPGGRLVVSDGLYDGGKVVALVVGLVEIAPVGVGVTVVIFVQPTKSNLTQTLSELSFVGCNLTELTTIDFPSGKRSSTSSSSFVLAVKTCGSCVDSSL